MITILIFTAFIAALLVYFIVARKAGKTSLIHPDQYFLSTNSYSSDQFAVAQIGYSLQMATVYPFFIFAFSGMTWIAVWNTLFYALGIILLIFFLPKFQKRHVHLIGSSKTLHAFIASVHEKPYLRRLTAWLSIIGFIGLTVFEITWGSRVIKVLFNDNMNVYYFTIAILATYLIFYLWLGGQRGTYNTAQYQLVSSYFGIHAAVAWAVLNPSVDYSKLEVMQPVMVAVVILSGVMFIRRLKDIRRSLVLNILTLVSLVVMVYCILQNSSILYFSYTNNIQAAIESVFNNPDNTLPLLAFALLPIGFQFVDMSNWQRMVAVRNDNISSIKRIKQGLIQFLIESPLSWLLPIVLGLCAKQILTNISGDPWDAFLTKIFSGNGFQNIAISMLVIAGFTSIFLSTADGLMISVGYSFSYDISKRSQRLIDNKSKSVWSNEDVFFVINQGRRAMSWGLAVVILTFIVIDISFGKGADFIGAFLSFFTPMISFAPSILVPTLFKNRSSGNISLASICIPATMGIIGGITSIFYGGVWQWLPIIIAVCLSWLIYIAGFIVKRYPV